MLGRNESAFAYTPATDEVLNCQWFNASLYPAGTSVTISIDTRLCGPEYPATVVVEDWRQSCPNPQAGHTFEVHQSDGAIVTGTSDNAGLLTLQIAPGDLYISEAQPDAYPGGYAWCGTQEAGGEPMYVNAGRLSPGEPSMPLSNVKPDYTYVCQWFNAPLDSPAKATGEGGDITILKWRCPAGYEAAGATLEQLRADCPTPQPGVQIAVSYAGGDSFTAPTRLEKGPAIARFEGLPPGKVGIGESGVSGQELGRAFCRTSDVGLPGLTLTDGFAEYPVTDGGIAGTVADGQVVGATFNVPDGAGRRSADGWHGLGGHAELPARVRDGQIELRRHCDVLCRRAGRGREAHARGDDPERGDGRNRRRTVLADRAGCAADLPRCPGRDTTRPWCCAEPRRRTKARLESSPR